MIDRELSAVCNYVEFNITMNTLSTYLHHNMIGCLNLGTVSNDLEKQIIKIKQDRDIVVPMLERLSPDVKPTELFAEDFNEFVMNTETLIQVLRGLDEDEVGESDIERMQDTINRITH